MKFQFDRILHSRIASGKDTLSEDRGSVYNTSVYTRLAEQMLSYGVMGRNLIVVKSGLKFPNGKPWIAYARLKDDADKSPKDDACTH